MSIKKLVALLIILLSYAKASDAAIGQTIEINTRFHSFVGNPSWLIIIRDLDRGENVPYQFNINRGENHWMIYTHSKNYLITVSNMQISTYESKYNTYGSRQIENFCHLESHGKIIRGESMYLTISGDLTNDPNTVKCDITRFPE